MGHPLNYLLPVDLKLYHSTINFWLWNNRGEIVPSMPHDVMIDPEP